MPSSGQDVASAGQRIRRDRQTISGLTDPIEAAARIQAVTKQVASFPSREQ